MAGLKDIQRKIKSVQNTQKITKAMKLVSTAKLKKAEELSKRARDYAKKLNEVIQEIACQIERFQLARYESKYFKKVDAPKVVDIVFVTADKGLCGGFNATTIKKVMSLYNSYRKTENTTVRLTAIGKKGVDIFRFKGVDIYKAYTNVSATPSYDKAKDAMQVVMNDFVTGQTDKVILVYNGYKNMITQELKVIDLFPIEMGQNFEHKECPSVFSLEAEVEGYRDNIMDELVSKYAEFNLYYGLIDSLAAEHSSRMQAMETATNNAKELVGDLTLKYNRARQEAITTELIEIISGMEALK